VLYAGTDKCRVLSTITGVTTVTLRKLSREEAARAFARRGQTDVSEYVAALHALKIGESAEIALDGLSSRAVKRRLGLAATQVGYRLKWATIGVDDRLYFRVMPATTGSTGRAVSRRRTRPQLADPKRRSPKRPINVPPLRHQRPHAPADGRAAKTS
jgi:hypothetical protein